MEITDLLKYSLMGIAFFSFLLGFDISLKAPMPGFAIIVVGGVFYMAGAVVSLIAKWVIF